MENRLKQLSCLAIIKAFPDMIKGDALKQGRLKNLHTKLSKETDIVIHYYIRPSKTEMKQMQDGITEWTDKTGWENKQRHICTLVSFFVGISSDYMPKEDKLINLLFEIYKYFEREGNAPAACAVGGCLAMKKWNAVFDG